VKYILYAFHTNNRLLSWAEFWKV